MLKYVTSPLNYEKLIEENKAAVPCLDSLFQYVDTSDEDWDDIKKRRLAEERKKHREKKEYIRRKRREFIEHRESLKKEMEALANKRSSSVGRLLPKRSPRTKRGAQLPALANLTQKSVGFLSPAKSNASSPEKLDTEEEVKKPILTPLKEKMKGEVDAKFIKDTNLSKKTVEVLKGKYLKHQQADFFANEIPRQKFMTDKQKTDELGMNFLSFGSKNFHVQPKFMENRGSMCITELWTDKSKKQIIKKEKRAVIEMHKMIQYQKENREHLSVYRPDQMITQKETSQKAKDQRQNIVINPTNLNKRILKSMYNPLELILPSKLKEAYPKYLKVANEPHYAKGLHRSSSVVRVRPNPTMAQFLSTQRSAIQTGHLPQQATDRGLSASGGAHPNVVEVVDVVAEYEIFIYFRFNFGIVVSMHEVNPR